MKKCKQGYYYCHTDKKCKRIPTGYRVGLGGYLRKENGEEQGENDNADNTNGNGNGNGNSNRGSNGGGVSEGTLHKWFKGSKSKDGKGGWVNVLTGGTCASDEPGEGVPKCVSRDKYDSMTPAERRSAARRKKKADPGQQQKSGAAKPTYVSTDKPKKKKRKKMKEAVDLTKKSSERKLNTNPGEKPESPQENRKNSESLRKHRERFGDLAKEEVQVTEGKDKKGKGSGTKDACYHKVKSRYSVWPSAYASGALVKCRKVGAANWGNKSEEMDYASFADRAKKTLEKNKKKTLRGETKTTKEEWIVDNAAQYFFNEGINEDGLVIFIEELGVENFVEFVHDLAEDSELIEAYALTGKKKTPKRLPKGTQPAKTTKATIARGDRTIKAASPSGAFKKRPAAEKAVETAKEKQPEKKPVKSTLAKGVADTLARGALSAWKGHKAAMKKKKEGGSVASQVGAGLATAAGAMLKKGKKHLSDDYQYSDWREDFKAMEYEFIDLIKPEPLVSEASFEINPQKHREEVKAKKIRDRTKTGDEGSEIAKKKVKGPKLMGEDKYSDLSKNAARMSLLNNPSPRSTPEQTAEKKARLEKKRGMKLDDHPQFKKEEVDKRRAPAELVSRLSAKREGHMAQDGPNKPAYDAKQRILAKTKAKRMGEEVETIDEAGKKCWKGYKKAGTQKLFGKTYNRCVKANEEFVDEAKDETEIGITGLPIPKKKRSPKKQYEFEKARRKNLGTNVGGKTYKKDVTPYYNPRTRVEEKEDNIGGGNLKKLAGKATKRIDADTDGDVDTKDMSSSETGEFIPSPCGKKKLKPKVRFEKFDWKSSIDEDWQKVNKSDKTDGMSKKAVAAYRRENPGSKLKTAVTGDPKPGSKDAKRRKSFCARSKGQQDMHNIDCSKTPDKPVCKARRRWKC